MITLTFHTLLLAASLAAPLFEIPGTVARSEAPAFRISASAGNEFLTDDSSQWISQAGGSIRIAGQRHAFNAFGKFWFTGAMAVRHSTAEMTLSLSSADMGLRYDLPSLGAWTWLTAYTRMSVEASWARLSVGGSTDNQQAPPQWGALTDDTAVFGAQVGAGAHIAPRWAGRFFATSEATYTARTAARFALTRDFDTDSVEEETGEAPLQTAAIRTGPIALSGWALRLGVGLTF